MNNCRAGRTTIIQLESKLTEKLDPGDAAFFDAD
jgi:hypothetical protein